MPTALSIGLRCRGRMVGRPYSKLIEILQSTLRQVERDAVLKPEDKDLAKLKTTLERTIASFDSRRGTNDADLSE
jgi:hypothetical protein